MSRQVSTAASAPDATTHPLLLRPGRHGTGRRFHQASARARPGAFADLSDTRRAESVTLFTWAADDRTSPVHIGPPDQRGGKRAEGGAKTMATAVLNTLKGES